MLAREAIKCGKVSKTETPLELAYTMLWWLPLVMSGLVGVSVGLTEKQWQLISHVHLGNVQQERKLSGCVQESVSDADNKFCPEIMVVTDVDANSAFLYQYIT
jgi:hypothetical protein